MDALKMARKRIQLSISPELHEALNTLAHYQGRPTTTVIVDLLDECKPAVDLMIDAYKKLEQGVNKDDVLKGMIADGLNLASDKVRDL